MNLINTVTLEYPRSLWQLRQANPNVSFPVNPTDEELAPFDHANVHPTPQPSYDARTERIEESTTPAPYVDGIYRQQWAVVALSEAEAADYYRATHPPRWLEFGAVVMALPEIKALLNGGIAAGETPLALGLAVGLGKAADGDSRVFTNTWHQACAAGLIPPELITNMQMLATAHDLPAEFIAGLAK